MIAAGCEVNVADGSLIRSEFVELARDADALLGATFRAGRMDRELLGSLRSLRIISKYTIGVDDVDVDAATELGILVTHCPVEANWGGVAEGTLAFMLAFHKKLRERDRRVKAGGWRARELQGLYFGARDDGYRGLTVGIVGLGRIGSRVADLLAPWRMNVLACDPYIEERIFAEHGTRRVDLDTLLDEADIVTLHCNLTAGTRQLMNTGTLARMKPAALLINTSRGAVVDLDALCDAIDAGTIAGAALDVLPEEPPPAGARILGLADKVILSPHMVAANDGGALTAAIGPATEAVLSALRGEVPEHVYNTAAIPEWRARFANDPLLQQYSRRDLPR